MGRSSDSGSLELRLLGEMSLTREGEPLALPQSKKTRALLAYLAVTGRPHRRERLCSLLWDVPDDPRGSLRWSLSKLRAVVDEPGKPRILADRQTVAFDSSGMAVDLPALQKRLAGDFGAATAEHLIGLEKQLTGEFLQGLDLPRCDDFQAWCVAVREETKDAHARLLNALVERLWDRPDDALGFARRLVELSPYEVEARIRLVGLLAAAGRRGEAEQQYKAGCLALEELDPQGPMALEQAWRRIGEGRGAMQIAPGPERREPGPAVDDPPVAETLPLPDKPSIAVLPIECAEGDPELQTIAEGVAWDLTSALSTIRSLFVIAPATTFALEGTAQDQAGLSGVLGVGHLLVGGLERRDDTLGLSARITDCTTGESIWSEQYDRPLKELLPLESDIVDGVATALDLGPGAVGRTGLEKPEPMDAWLECQRGRQHLLRRSREELIEASRCFDRAADLDPGYRAPLIASLDAYYYQFAMDLQESNEALGETAIAQARRALDLDPEDGAAHCALGKAHLIRKEHWAAIVAFESAVALNQNLAWAHYGLGAALIYSGQPAKAVAPLEMAMRLSPRDGDMGSFLARIAEAHLLMRQYDRAVELGRRALAQPHFRWSRYAVLISALGHLDRIDEARSLLQEVLVLRPDFSLELVRSRHLFTDQVTLEFVGETHLFTDQDEFAHYLEGLRKAGVAAESAKA